MLLPTDASFPLAGPDLQLVLYAIGAAVVLIILFNLPKIGPALRGLFSFAVLAGAIWLFLQQAPYSPGLGAITSRLGLDDQRVVGDEVRIRMSPDGHFWARATVDGIERRMLVDSGATITVLSGRTAAATETATSLMPIILQTANGAVAAQTAKVGLLTLGGIEARNLRVVIAPMPNGVDVIGMNFLSQLQSWRVEGRTLVMVPQPAG
ncbi:retropepsin-like aspartic protease family protein [Sandarakinorhabdus sp. DWP1-3-1]|uniref:retropepsin-like aspartic protease family protein n=1 Tax=Sandarakinorhabdus sp. DWP1-3-1 TaxID=2804627 RepID=UPI003CF1B68A